MSRTLLATRIAAARRPIETPLIHASAGAAAVVDVAGANGGDQTEEHEHEHLAESVVAVGDRAVRVPEGGEDRNDPDGEDHPPGEPDQVGPGNRREAECDRDAALHLARGEQSGRHGPRGSDPCLGVGALLGIGEVVCEVHADLDGDRRKQGHDECIQPKDLIRAASALPTTTAATPAGNVAGRAASTHGFMEADMRRETRDMRPETRDPRLEIRDSRLET